MRVYWIPTSFLDKNTYVNYDDFRKFTTEDLLFSFIPYLKDNKQYWTEEEFKYLSDMINSKDINNIKMAFELIKTRKRK